MNSIMDPPAALLNSNRTPFVLIKKSVLRQMFRNVRRKNHMSFVICEKTQSKGVSIDLPLNLSKQRTYD